MKILVISAAFPPMHAGEASNAFHLCKHLADLKLEVHVLTSQSNVGTNDPSIIVHPIMRSWSWLDMPRFRTFLKRCAPDAVLLMYIGLMYNSHPMITFTPTISKRVMPRVPFVTRFESAFVGADPQKTSLVSRAIRKVVAHWAGGTDVAYSSGTLLRDSDTVIALCERHRAMLMAEWPDVSAKTVLIPPPPNLQMCADNDDAARRRGREALGVRANDFLIAFLGYLYPIKGIETLLQAFQIVKRQRSHVSLMFIGGKVDLEVEGGSSYYEAMRELSRQLGVDDSAMWTGAFNSEDEEASLYLHAADAGVLPFLEGVQLNNSSFSSMVAHGLPMIVTRGPMLDQPFMHGENVLLCKPRDPAALAESMMQLMDDDELRKRLRTGSRKLAQEWFSWEKAIDRTLATFRTRARQQHSTRG